MLVMTYVAWTLHLTSSTHVGSSTWDMDGTLGYFVLENFHKRAESDTWRCTRVRHGYPSPSNIGHDGEGKQFSNSFELVYLVLPFFAYMPFQLDLLSTI